MGEGDEGRIGGGEEVMIGGGEVKRKWRRKMGRRRNKRGEGGRKLSRLENTRIDWIKVEWIMNGMGEMMTQVQGRNEV
jgi:hypothetical protein